MENARRHKVQDRFYSVDHERVARVSAALVANDVIRLSGKDVDDFSFAFISPLRADDDDS